MSEENEVENTEVTEVELSEVEQKAVEQNWKPKDQFVAEGGKEEEWRPAKEFLERGELFQKIEALSKDLKSTRSTLNALKGHYEKVKETEFKHALDSLKQDKKQALLDGDADAVVEIDDKIASVRETQAKQKEVEQAQVQEIHPDFAAWTQKETWYVRDPSMAQFADKMGRAYAVANPGVDPKEVLDYVSKVVRSEYPDKFKNARREAPSSVETSRTTSKAPKAAEVALNEEETRIMNKLVAQGVLTKEKYMADLKKVKERS